MVLTPPARIYDFDSHQRANPRLPAPGDRLDAQFQQLIDSIQSIQGVLGQVLRSDGELKSGSVKPESLDPEFKTKLFSEIQRELTEIRSIVEATGHEARAQADAATRAAREATSGADFVGQEAQTLRAEVQEALRRVETTKKVALEAESRLTDIQTSLLARATVLEQDGASAGAYAQASREWAEHMPGTLPADTVAVMDLTGEHWSARWWANQAAGTYGRMAEWYQGSHHEPPVETGDGRPLPPGALYFDLDTYTMMVWTGSGWIPVATPLPGKGLTVTLDYKATAGQTIFPFGIADLHGQTFLVTASDPYPVEVFRAGRRLTADDGSGTIGEFTYTPANNAITLLPPAATANERVVIDILQRPEDLAPGGILKHTLVDIDIDPSTGNPGYSDGVRTTFTLRTVVDGTPVSPPSDNALEVVLNGVPQQPGIDFHVEADTIVFTQAPEADAVAWITWLEPFGGGAGAVTEAFLDCGEYP